MKDVLINNASRLEISVRLIDAFALVFAAQLAGYAQFHANLNTTEPIHVVLQYFVGILAFFSFGRLGIYDSWRGRPLLGMFATVGAAFGSVMLISLFFSFLVNQAGNVSRSWLVYWYIFGMMFLLTNRLLIHATLRTMRRMGLNNKRVLIVGYGRTGREMHRRAQEQDWYGYTVSAVHGDDADVEGLDDTAIQRLETMDEIPDYVARNRIHEIWIALPMEASIKMARLQYLLRNALVDIRWIPDTLSLQMLSNRQIEFLGTTAVDLNCPVSSGLGGLLKELFDRVFALVALILLAPLFLVIAILIKLSSSGPVLFKQPRLGLNGKQIMVYKFRSMKVHAEQGVVTQATRGDPRITRIGGFLRRTSLDELPQFINVLKGDMSVVGPRPHALQHNDKYKELLEMYMVRHRVKPGITGWAQIHGHRGETDTVDKMNKRVQFDLYYIKNWSFLMDLKIIFWTTFKGWTGTNAY